MNFEIVFQPYGKRADFPPGTTILDAGRKLGIDIASICGGKGTCGKCKVKIDKGVAGCNSLTPRELKCLTKEEMTSNFRLACQVIPTTSTIVYVPERSRTGKQRLQTEGIEVSVAVKPLVRKFFVKLPVPTLEDPKPDYERLEDALLEKHRLPNLVIEFEVLKSLPQVLREAKWEVTAVLWNNRIIAVEKGDTTQRSLGFAVDIGSTKLAGFLVDLTTGKVLSVAARMNPQIPIGEDILSRISYVMMKGWPGSKELQDRVVSGINEMIEEACQKAKADTWDIYELSFVGNTAMQMLFLGLWPSNTALAPYPPVRRAGINLPARTLGLKSHPQANAYYAPIIGGFVGADSVADLMAVDMLKSEELVMDIDIGTNTEIAVGNRERVLIASTASGPAFEGMEIKYGMRAATGAIEKISIDPTTLEASYGVIEGTAPVGICGSGLIDALAELVKTGVIDMSGRFNPHLEKETRRIRKTPEGWYEYVVAWKEETGSGTEITVTQADVRELQKAKAAIHTGAELLMRRVGLREKDITTLFIAGAFGNYIDPESARTVGMYPEVAIERIKFVGNTAGTGARMCLTSEEMRKYAEEISKSVAHVELALDKDFQREYLKSFNFPHKDLDRYPVTVDLLRRIGRQKLPEGI